MPHLYSTLSIAPMIDWSYADFRILMRIIAPSCLVYTDMQTTGAVEHNPERSLFYYSDEHPIALQLGGSDPEALYSATQLANQRGYDEINLNLGCPSDKVQAGRFGACLMSEPNLVKECISAMKSASKVTVSAKTRIGIDDCDSYEFFAAFIENIVKAGCDKIIVHARKAWLHGLNPKQNRTIPPVHYDYVYKLKNKHPEIPIVINGNINTNEAAEEHLCHVDGVMIGRLACQNPYALAKMYQSLNKETTLLSRADYLEQYFAHMKRAYDNGGNINLLMKPIFNFAHGLPGANRWKKLLMSITQTKNTHKFKEALGLISDIEQLQTC